MTRIYDDIGLDYNHTRNADEYLAHRFNALMNFKKDGLYVDLGCGTGNYTIKLYTGVFSMIGLDPSTKMLSTAQQRNSSIEWILGSAEELPFHKETIDGFFGCMTIHHWSSLSKGFSEIYRSLKNDGVLVFFTSSAEQMENYWLNHYFPEMMRDSINQMPSLSEIQLVLDFSGFMNIETEIYHVKNDLQDKFLYSGKHQPNFYLNPSFRKGISSFASLAVKEEVATGLSKLEADINSNKIQEIIRAYDNDLGDYMFVKAKKVND